MGRREAKRISRRSRRDGERLHAYLCPTCHAYHVGHLAETDHKRPLPVIGLTTGYEEDEMSVINEVDPSTGTFLGSVTVAASDATSLNNAAAAGIDADNAFLCGCQAQNADFTGASLRVANAAGANLPGAKLAGADLTFAALQGANLMGADLRGANLSQANLTSALLTGAKYDGRTQFPIGFNPGAAGMIYSG